ncbi:magnesium chelatase subunit D [Krasilnikovia cinnamomea]|uniref:Mg-protoporphyrin IX chelatase n=1 Tax=Krasilnikovia cinnamomea TaxID=349313 RepID=A0A4Q7ZD61_9ACTN|nr:VWA domain-containing protein [Krasilnikovia cinnamomea]RZU48600.1 magnesium chelatase subunit D [Krasilnikovia cinnamomea]
MLPAYPFSAVVGLDDLRLALLLTAVSPAVGGVLVRGEKGTAKSTVVRALAGLLPEVDVVRGCRFACDPAGPDPDCPDGPHEIDAPHGHRPATLVELPVGATEDRVVGTLDIQRALADGVKAYEPGLLAAAHRGALYVDEVNLLPDHLVDLLLDAAAMGRAHVERDGVSVKHAARFLLVGTMNPEEGEPRPQLVDRFGLVVTVAAPRDAGQRAEVVRRRLAYEADPAGFTARFADAERTLAHRIAEARAALPGVALPDAELDRIARVCLAYGVDGMRADIVVARCAVALAAWHGRDRVTGDDVKDAARLALPHRRRRDPLDPPGTDEQRLEEALAQADPDDDPPTPPDGGAPPPDDGPAPGDGPHSGDTQGPPPGDRDPSGADGSSSPSRAQEHPPEPAAATDRPGPAAGHAPLDQPGESASPGRPRSGTARAGAAFRPRTLRIAARGDGGHAGRRSPAYARRGRVVGARAPHGRLTGAPHLPATLRAALHRAAAHRTARPGGLAVQPRDLRQAVHVGREANLVLFVVDASGSMAARRRMTVVKTAVLSLLRDAYQRRDRIGMITFRGSSADQVLPPTSSHEVGVLRLASLRTGGRTPLAAGLRAAAATIATERRRDPRRRPLLVVVTDGRATSGPDPTTLAGVLAGVATVVVDCESGPVRLGLARRLAAALDADLVPLEHLEHTTTRRAA